MRGIYRLKLALTVWTAAVLGLGAAGCQQMFPVAATGMSSQFANGRVPGDGSKEIIRAAGSQSAYAPTMLPASAPVEPSPSQLPSTIGESTAPMGTVPTTTAQPVVVETPPPAPLPGELRMTFHPTYIIEPPDTLIIDAIRLIPRPPYRIEPLDVLIIQVAETLPNQPISGAYAVAPDGTISLGYSYQEYGPIRVAGLTLEQAAVEIKARLKKRLNEPQVALALASMRAIQQIRGEHLVGQDGTVTLGAYGCVNVTGLTLWQAKLVIERYLSRWFLTPDISITVNGYNSKVYYVIYDGGGYGQQMVRLPITGKDTVLDAIATLGGLPSVSSRRKMWVARPSPKCCYQLLPINWEAITKGGDPETNWQLFPGDRIYVEADPLISLDNALAKIFAPVERVLGITLLGSAVNNSLKGNVNNGIGIVP